jgi:hypothetical protein
MSAVAIPTVRAEVANTSLANAQEFAEMVLQLETTAEVLAVLEERNAARNTIQSYLSRMKAGAVPAHYGNGGELS